MRAAAVQLNSTADPSANLASADRLTRAAAADGAGLIVLPEKWTAIGTDEQLRSAAESLDGPAIAWARATARELGVDLVAGSILERLPGQQKLANTSVHVGPDGELRAVYRKLKNEVGENTYQTLLEPLKAATIEDVKQGGFKFKLDDAAAEPFLQNPQPEKIQVKIDFGARVQLKGLKEPFFFVEESQISASSPGSLEK